MFMQTILHLSLIRFPFGHARPYSLEGTGQGTVWLIGILAGLCLYGGIYHQLRLAGGVAEEHGLEAEYAQAASSYGYGFGIHYHVSFLFQISNCRDGVPTILAQNFSLPKASSSPTI